MRPEGSPLDLNHSPKQTIPDCKVCIPFSGANFYEERIDLPHVATEASPTRSIKGGGRTSENDDKEGSDDDFGEGTDEPHSFTQTQHNWPAGRAMPPSSVPQVGSGSPWEISASQFDTSNTSISSSERLAKRKRISESGEDEAADLKYKCRFCGQFFSKSQALGGHMNRHRPEREQEQLKQARALVQQNQHRPMLFQNLQSPLRKFIPRTPPSVPTYNTGMQTHQPSNPYHPSQRNWIPGTSQNSPFASAQDINYSEHVKQEWTSAVHQIPPAYAPMLNVPHVKFQEGNRDRMPGMSYERNPAQQQQAFPSDPENTARVWPSVGAGSMQKNYDQKQDGESTSAVTDRRFNPGFESQSSYPQQLGVHGSEFSGQGSEALQQFGLPSLIPSGFQLLHQRSSNTTVDFTKASGTSLDAQNPQWLCHGAKSTPTLGSMPNDQDVGLALVSDPIAFEGRMAGLSHNFQGPGIGQLTMEGESGQGRQRPVNNNIHGADFSSLSYGIDCNPVAEIENKYNQGFPKGP